ncbi:MAG: argininosuccinate synthase [Deltaproteobacteria bacterium]|nr:argininosuccinate synthase [Deltaproteobacteria bacterium]
MRLPKHPKKIVLAYSGGLDTSVMLHWLKKTFDCEIVCYTADIGQAEELDGLDAKARATGAEKAIIEDLTDRFVSEFVFPAVQANAVYEGTYLMGTSLARPLIGRRLAEIAAQEGADAVAHGATGKGNDQIRFELASYGVNPHIRVIAPWRFWEFKGRTDLIAYAKDNGIPVLSTVEKPFSIDRNIMHVSFEGGVLEDPWAEPPSDTYLLTRPLEQTPNEAEEVLIDFERGIPVAVNGEALAPRALVERLNAIGGRHGVGRVDMVENRYVGIKSRGVYETPGVTLLHQAHRAVESLALDREVMLMRDELMPKYATLIYRGYWYSPECELLRKIVNETQVHVTGTAKLRLFKGGARVIGRKSPNSLYSYSFATFEKDTVYDQFDAEGFIRINALRLRLRSLKESGLE